MSYTRPLVSFIKKGIDAKTTGATKMGTTENGTERFHPIFAVINVSAANTIAVVPTLSVGTNGASYNNILVAAAMTGLSALHTLLKSDIVGATGNVAPNTEIYVNISVGATATAMSLDVHLFGYYT